MQKKSNSNINFQMILNTSKTFLSFPTMNNSQNQILDYSFKVDLYVLYPNLFFLHWS